MHGLICKSLEGFLIDQHGPAAWSEIRDRAALPVDGFEALRSYDDDMMLRLLAIAARHLGRRRLALCEDMGHWICTHPPLEPVRRLIRFSGATFVDLLYALDEVYDRARIAIPGMDLPRYAATELSPGHFEVTSRWSLTGGGAVLTGMLRAMADDYGALALIETQARGQEGPIWRETIDVRVVEHAFHEPREFVLGGAA